MRIFCDINFDNVECLEVRLVVGWPRNSQADERSRLKVDHHGVIERGGEDDHGEHLTAEHLKTTGRCGSTGVGSVAGVCRHGDDSALERRGKVHEHCERLGEFANFGQGK